jgi:proteic killer suppression protein
VIRSYRDKRTARFARGERVKEFEAIAEQAKRRMARLVAAKSLRDLAAAPGNHLEALKGKRARQHSIRINRQWRICFVWNDAEGCAELVEIVDYH